MSVTCEVRYASSKSGGPVPKVIIMYAQARTASFSHDRSTDTCKQDGGKKARMETAQGTERPRERSIEVLWPESIAQRMCSGPA